MLVERMIPRQTMKEVSAAPRHLALNQYDCATITIHDDSDPNFIIFTLLNPLTAINRTFSSHRIFLSDQIDRSKAI
jgi:hypothetical protein